MKLPIATAADFERLPVPAGTSEARHRFWLKRREMFEAFSVWMKERPDQGDIEEELDATKGVLRQLTDLWVGVGR